MIRLTLRRLSSLVPLVWLVATLTFAVVHLVPGTYADLLDNPRLTPEGRQLIRHRYGLDLPVHHQYVRWLSGIVRGDLGISFLYRRPVAEVVAEALPATLLLTGTALTLDLVLGLLLAVSAVRKPHGLFDRMTAMLSLGIYGMPSFWLAFLAILVFSVLLGWFPSSHMSSVDAGQMSAGQRLLDLVWHLALPSLCLGLAGAAATARYLRSTLLELGSERFILAARARGVPERRIRWVHTLRPALLPVVTMIGLSVPFLVSGSVVIETVFAWPGMGRVLWDAATARDLPVIMAITMLGAVAVILGNLVADLLYAVIDPRARSTS